MESMSCPRCGVEMDERTLVEATVSACPDGHGVFQYLGDIDRPGMIGLVRRGGDWILFDPFAESVWTSRSGRWTDYARLAGAEKAAADALINEWARQRWLRRLQVGAAS